MLTKKEKYNIAVVGATGIVGESLLSILHSRKFPISSIVAVASDKSKGTKVKFGDKLLTVESQSNVNVFKISIFSGKLLAESTLLLFLSTLPILYCSLILEFIILNPGESLKK